MPRKTYRYDPVSKEMVEVHRAPPDFNVPGIIDDLHPFVSPIDGTIITSRSHLRDYMGQRGLCFYDEAKTQAREEDRYQKARDDTAMRERMWEGLDRAQRTGRSPHRE